MPELAHNNPFGSTPNEATGLSTTGLYRTRTDRRACATWKGIDLFWRTYDVEHSSAVARHKYPNAAGQTIEPLGREPYSIPLESVWFGPEWRRRLDNFLWVLDSEQSSGELTLPDGRTFMAFCVAGTERYEAFDGCILPLSFEEDTPADGGTRPETDAVSCLEDSLGDFPATAAAVAPYVDEYLTLLLDPSANTTRALLEALRQLDAALYALQVAQDLTTRDGVQVEQVLALARWYAQRAFPFPDLLG